jgi:tetratricopeptide (TPR) repeat protein
VTDDRLERCPDPSVLAAFIEGALEEGSFREVKIHAADCSECAMVIAESVRFVTRERPRVARFRTNRSLWRWVAAVAALSAFAILWFVTARDPLERLKRLAADTGARPGEGRLDGFAYTPYVAQRSARSAVGDLSMEVEVNRLVQSGGTDARALHARGVALLYAGDRKGGRRLLALATGRDPRNPVLWSDLAAAEIADPSGDGSLALVAAEHAIALSPALAAAHFNRAVALERLGRRAEAATEYARAVELDPSSRWSAEARKNIARMSD